MSVTSKPLLLLKEDFVTYFDLQILRVIYERRDTHVLETVSRSDASVRRAVKHIRCMDSDGRAMKLKDISNELGILRRVNHPHVIELFAAGICRGYAAYSMPMYHRGSLARMRGHIEQDMLERCFVQAACAVRYLHSMNYAHGDIKPENIMIDDSDNAILCDFGLAHVLDEGNTAVSEWGGTEGYVGPEAWRQDQYNACLMDAYALGATLWSMVFRCKPGRRKLLVSVEYCNISDLFRSILNMLLAPNPEDRSTVPGLLEYLRKFDKFVALIDSL